MDNTRVIVQWYCAAQGTEKCPMCSQTNWQKSELMKKCPLNDVKNCMLCRIPFKEYDNVTWCVHCKRFVVCSFCVSSIASNTKCITTYVDPAWTNQAIAIIFQCARVKCVLGEESIVQHLTKYE